jgi:ribosomal protein S17E
MNTKAKKFIEESNKKHNNFYDYSLVKEFKNVREKVEIICPDHGVFKQMVRLHKNGSKCPLCPSKSKITVEKFIEQSNEKHNYKYDYSLVKELKTVFDTIEIICPIHGTFNQIANIHKKGFGCQKCSNCAKITVDEFIKRANKKHDSKYDYSLVKEFKNVREKVEIICPDHGIFKQKINNHMTQGDGCPACSGCTKVTLQKFIEQSNKKHNNFYDYSLVTELKTVFDTIEIICPIHGTFNQIANVHKKGFGCSECSGNTKVTVDEFIKRSSKRHVFKYNYSLVKEFDTIKEKVEIICPNHGPFKQAVSNHMHGGDGCPKCAKESTMSKGEQKIKTILDILEIEYEQEKVFEEFIQEYDSRCRFDFYIPHLRMIIEFDGKQHFEAIPYFGGEETFTKLVENDIIKNEFCKKNKIFLYRIKYDDDVGEAIFQIFDDFFHKIESDEQYKELVIK